MTKEELIKLLEEKHKYKVEDNEIYAKGYRKLWKVGFIPKNNETKVVPINIVYHYSLEELSLMEIQDLISACFWFTLMLLEEPEFNNKGE